MREIASPDLARLTTLRLGGHAIVELWLENLDDVGKLPERLSSLGAQPVCIGRGSNILFRDGELPLALIRIKTGSSPVILGKVGDKVLVKAGSGVYMPALIRFCLANELSGLEGLVGIPGTVGGAVAMNAGSFGREITDCLHEVLAIGEKGIKLFNSSQIHARYRSMAFEGEPQTPVILEAIFTLTQSSKNGIFSVMHHNFFKKKSRQPLDAWSAGSAFKNPGNGLFAGRLLEAAGFRGKKYHGMAFSDKHANFLINEGKGTSGAALDLLELAAEAVQKQSGIRLEPEIRIIPWH